MEKNQGNFGSGDDFLDTIPKAQSMKEIIDKLHFIKIKNCSAKDTIKIRRRQATDWEKIFIKDASKKGPLSKIYKELLTLSNKKTKT